MLGLSLSYGIFKKCRKLKQNTVIVYCKIMKFWRHLVVDCTPYYKLRACNAKLIKNNTRTNPLERSVAELNMN